MGIRSAWNQGDEKGIGGYHIDQLWPTFHSLSFFCRWVEKIRKPRGKRPPGTETDRENYVCLSILNVYNLPVPGSFTKEPDFLGFGKKKKKKNSIQISDYSDWRLKRKMKTKMKKTIF